MKMGGIAYGFYQTGRELKERPELLSTPPEKVNSIGAKVLEFISDFGRPSAPIPAAIVACVPNKVHVDGFGKIESSSEITGAIKSGLEEPIEVEPELKVPKELISLSELRGVKVAAQAILRSSES
ncbi:hypothetical protein Patl1_21169 [Pistacia atlantica]|uniref:Uncharacterized protein n=1 Tax=Pistacia atlantica TaxID=434234 RepID=A0ACC1BJQ2_9ROSI|nr:hypothetical protein Patl1_21169 [Pistacia atlantica]